MVSPTMTSAAEGSGMAAATGRRTGRKRSTTTTTTPQLFTPTPTPTQSQIQTQVKKETKKAPAKTPAKKRGRPKKVTVNEVFCICRGKDDGRPMVRCENCADWYVYLYFLKFNWR